MRCVHQLFAFPIGSMYGLFTIHERWNLPTWGNVRICSFGFSHNHGSVENYPKENRGTNLRDIPFPMNHDCTRKNHIQQSLHKIVAQNVWLKFRHLSSSKEMFDPPSKKDTQNHKKCVLHFFIFLLHLCLKYFSFKEPAAFAIPHAKSLSGKKNS